MAVAGIDASPTSEILIEESVIGWKEFELEVMRDLADNVVIICSIENFDPMGVHTGDSITVAPAQTLTDKEYQLLRDASIRIIREIGVETGGSNIQFGINPDDGRMVVIEMNPRVSRSSALASKATGFPIAKIAAKLAVGYTLDEIPNDITRETSASFEPTIDYVVTKMPRFTFEKFPQADATLTTQMKSVGEAMAIGRTFKESLQKALRSLEIGSHGFESRLFAAPEDYRRALSTEELDLLRSKLRIPNADRLWYLADALRAGFSIEEIYGSPTSTPGFCTTSSRSSTSNRCWWRGRGRWPSPMPVLANCCARPRSLAFPTAGWRCCGESPRPTCASCARQLGIRPVYKRVDTCGAEFVAYTPYLYSTYETSARPSPTDRKKIMILGGGPNRIGQGIEFDYCCVHGVLPWPRTATKRSWSTATRRPFPPTTTPPTGSTSSR